MIISGPVSAWTGWNISKTCRVARAVASKSRPDGSETMNTRPIHVAKNCIWIVCLVLAATTTWSAESGYPGFTLIAPAGEDWRLVQQNAGSLVWMKRVEMVDASFLVAVLTNPAPVLFDSQETFLAFVKKAKQTNPNPQRFVVRRSEIEAVSAPGPFCVSYDTAIEDSSTVSSGGKPLLLEVTGLACLHPDALNRYFDIQFSSRHPVDVATRESELLDGKSFVDGFEFSGPPQDGKWALGKRPLQVPANETT